MSAASQRSVLEALSDARIEFVLVGALAGVVRGAAFTTLDVDIVHRRTPDNLERLHALLQSIHAEYRGRPAAQRLEPTRAHLDTAGHVLLRTDLGPLDVLGAIERGRDYDWLIARSEPLAFFGRTVAVPSLDALIEIRAEGTRPEDALKLQQLLSVRQALHGK